MTAWPEALEIVVARTGHARFRVLCDENNPDVARRDAYRALVVAMATGEPAPTPEDLALRADVARGGCCG